MLALLIIAVRIVDEKVTVTGDDSEQVVEVVGDAAGKPSDSFHLLRLPELFLAFEKRLFGALALGEIATNDHSAAHVSLLIEQRPPTDGDPETLRGSGHLDEEF